jgi:hypothetical protein
MVKYFGKTESRPSWQLEFTDEVDSIKPDIKKEVKTTEAHVPLEQAACQIVSLD